MTAPWTEVIEVTEEPDRVLPVAYVYCITNLINGKRYVGKTNDLDRRWRDHQNNCSDEKCPDRDKLLYKAMRKYGVENFEFAVLWEQ
jgi:group I intron endonuclease